MEIYLLFAKKKFFYERQPVLVSLPMAKPVVTQGAKKRQMKDTDNTFPLIPLSFLLVGWVLSKLSFLPAAQQRGHKEGGMVG